MPGPIAKYILALGHLVGASLLGLLLLASVNSAGSSQANRFEEKPAIDKSGVAAIESSRQSAGVLPRATASNDANSLDDKALSFATSKRVASLAHQPALFFPVISHNRPAYSQAQARAPPAAA